MIINPYRFKQSTPPFSNVNSFSFDGIDDYFMIPSAITLPTDFSISVWVKFTTLSSSESHIINTGTSNSNRVGVYSSTAFQVKAAGTNVYFSETGGNDFVTNQWQHVLVTRDSSNNMSVFRNGSSFGSSTTLSGTLTLDSIFRFNSTQYALGSCDELAVWTRELSQSDVTAIYNNGEPQSLDSYSPFVWFRMGDNATWNGFAWTMTSVGTDTRTARSANMVEANRTTDVPPNPFSNTLSTYFDGVDDTVSIPSLPSTFTNLSISFWLKKGVDSSNAYVFSRSTSQWLIFQNATNNSLKYRLITSGGTYTKTGGAILDSQWHHCAFVWDSSTNTFDIYEDGVKIGTSTNTSGSLISSTASAYIFSFVNGAPYSSGKVDELAIFDSALSQSDITSIYNSGVPNDLSSLSPISWWRMGDGDTANTITDNVGSNNGTMVNMNASNFVTDVPTLPFTNTKSIALDGVDDYVSTGLNLSYTTYPNVSFSCWIKMDKASLNTFTSYSPTGAYVQTYPNSSPIRIYTNASKEAFVLVQGNGTSQSTTDLADGNWHHIVQTARYEASGTVNNVYVDGVKEITNQLFLSYAPITGDFFVGSRTATTQFFVGGIDEVAVFDSELAQSDITAIYGSGVPTSLSSYSSLVSWWRCGDGDTAPTLTDNGSGGNNGTIQNFSTFSNDVPTIPFTNTQSILLDGIDDYIDCGTTLGDNLGSAYAGDQTVSLWYKRTSSRIESPFQFGNQNFAYGRGVGLLFVNNDLRVSINDNWRAAYTTTFDTNWHHVLYSAKNNGDNTFDLKLYLDGTEVINTTVNIGRNNLVLSPNVITWVGRASSYEFQGNIDEVAFWDSDQSANASAIYNSGVPASLATYNPLLWYRMGDGDTSPTITDNGSSGNDGTMTNFSTFSTDVPAASSFANTKSILLDGVDDFVDCGNGASLQITGALTISAWVKTTDTNYIGIYGKGNSVALSDVYFRMQNTGVIRVFINNTSVNVTGTTAINDGNWHHVMFVYVPSTSMTIYVDGSQDAQNTTSIPSAINNNYSNVYIGQFQKWLGNIDEVAVWNSAINISDVWDGSGVPFDISSSNPLSWWRCGDGDTAPILSDNGSGGNDGTMTNFTTFSTDVPTAPSFTNTKSIALDGVDDFVNVTDADNLSFGDGSSDSPFSISAWIKMNDATRFFVLSKGLVFSSNYEYLLNTNASDKLALSLYDSSNNSRIGRLYNTPLTSYENQWVHICSTYSGNGLSSGIKVYINGVRVDDTDSNSGTYVAMENGNRNLNIGRTETGLYSNGKIDEVSVFNTELSQSDITSIYGGGVPSSLSSYSSLVSWWRFEGSGTTAIDSGSGGNNGTLTNGVTRSTDVPTFSKKSIALDGVDDFINVPNSASLQITSALSISFWIYGRNNAKHTGIITKTPNTSNLVSTTQYHIQFQDSNKLRFAITGLDLYAGQETTGTVPTVVAGVWQHITMTWNGSDTMTIYKDGAQVCTKVQSTTISSNTDAVYLGRRNGWGHLLGKLDEVSIFNTELSSSNVTSIYNGGEPNDISSLSPISWWRCGDGDTSPTLTDNGSGGNDGTMTNFTTFSTDVPT